MTLTRSGHEIADYFAEALAAIEWQAGLATGEDALKGPGGGALRPRFNLAPSQEVLTLAPATNEAERATEFAWRRWGLVPSWAKDPAIGNKLFNARSETVAEKPSFRAAFKRRRCLVVADGFYEWTPRNRGHAPFHFRSASTPFLAMGGLFESWRGEGGEVIESCTVLTTDASQDLEGIHHRMPVLIDRRDLATWLDVSTSPDRLVPLMAPAPPGSLERKAVSRFVNDARHEGEACLASAEEDRPKAKRKAAQQPSLFALDEDAGDPSHPDEEEF